MQFTKTTLLDLPSLAGLNRSIITLARVCTTHSDNIQLACPLQHSAHAPLLRKAASTLASKSKHAHSTRKQSDDEGIRPHTKG
jgi:hypothetical protein